MKRAWETEELIEHWTLLPPELELLANKSGATRLGFALLLKFFQQEARFPTHPQEIPDLVIAYVAKRVEVAANTYPDYDWQGRTIKYHRVQIRTVLGFREVSTQDAQALATWLTEHVLPTERDPARLKALLYQRCREVRLEPPTPERVERLVASAIHQYEEQFCRTVLHHLPPAVHARLDALLRAAHTPSLDAGEPAATEPARAILHGLKAEPGRASLESFLEEVTKLERLRALALPADLFRQVPHKVLQL